MKAAGRVVFRWDLDKTYLKTEFDSLRGLARIPFESARDKVAAPGVAALIRGLRASGERRGDDVRIVFVSGSPPQIGNAILEKLALDGIEHDGITFKDQWRRIRRGKFRDLREQVGYKLTELLRDRRDERAGTVEYLFGDDWESDPLIYSLYADVVAGAVRRDELAKILAALRVDGELCVFADVLAGEVATGDAVRRVFINLARRTPPGRFRAYGVRLVPTFNYLQTAACLFDEGVLDVESVVGVVAAMRGEEGHDEEGRGEESYGVRSGADDVDASATLRLLNSMRDIERRGHLSAAGAAVLTRALERSGALPHATDGRARWRDAWLRLRRRFADGVSPVVAGSTDYGALVPALARQQESEYQVTGAGA